MNASTQDKIALAAIHNWLGFLVRQTNIPGMQLCILKQGDVIFDQAYGVASQLTQQPLNTQHLCAFSSHSKMITSAAVLWLQEKGKLSLSDKAARYIKEFATHPDTRAKEITVRDLLTHRSGFEREGPFGSFWEGEMAAPTREDVLCSIPQTKIIYDPNTVTKYSNYGYGLLGAIIESVAGCPYERVVQDLVAPAMGTEKLFPDVSFAPADQLSVAHSLAGEAGRRVSLKPVSAGGLASAFGVYASARGMARFTYEMLCGTKLLSPATQQELKGAFWHYHRSANHEYGHGLERTEIDKRIFLGHNGAHFGHQTQTRLWQDRGLVISAAFNAREPTLAIIRSVAEIVDIVTKNFDQKEIENVVVTEPLLGVEASKLFIVGHKRAIEIPVNTTLVTNSINVLERTGSTYTDTTRTGFDFDGEAVTFRFDGAGKIVAAETGGQILVQERAFRQRINNLRLNPHRAIPQ